MSEYAQKTWLHTPEIVLFLRYHDAIAHSRLLDIGVGGGRTTLYLRELTRQYVGLDYAGQMVELCQKRFPELPFFHCDVRDLRQFGAHSFDFVLFSWNGLDYIGHDDRKMALKEINHVLAPGGLFMFSSHNRNYRQAITRPTLEWSLNPARQYRHLLTFVAELGNRRKRRYEQVFTDDYALINDEAHAYALLTYYIGKNRQVVQLADAGFKTLDMVDVNGELIEPDSNDSHSSAIHYMAQKNA